MPLTLTSVPTPPPIPSFTTAPLFGLPPDMRPLRGAGGGGHANQKPLNTALEEALIKQAMNAAPVGQQRSASPQPHPPPPTPSSCSSPAGRRTSLGSCSSSSSRLPPGSPLSSVGQSKNSASSSSVGSSTSSPGLVIAPPPALMMVPPPAIGNPTQSPLLGSLVSGAVASSKREKRGRVGSSNNMNTNFRIKGSYTVERPVHEITNGPAAIVDSNGGMILPTIKDGVPAELLARPPDPLTSLLASARKSEAVVEGVALAYPAVSPLLSLPPLPRIDHAQQLEAVLRQQGCYETEQGLELRRETLKDLNILVRSWIQSVSLSIGMHWRDIGKIGGRIVTYGSFMLGISHQGADIDALCVAPQHISRKEYFDSFYNLLSFQQEVTELRSIEEAYVPVLKMKYNGIEIDMTFARLNKAEVPPPPPEGIEIFSDPIIPPIDGLSQLDEKCIRSLNGFRSTLEIKSLVPHLDVFRLALRAVKLWAKSQGLYSNILGYLGGFSWAVLVAKVCMDYPLSDAVDILRKFFHTFAEWPWPRAVTLTAIENAGAAPQAMTEAHLNPIGMSSLTLTSWNPDRNPSERYHVMPIITPTFPHINSTFNVSPNTKKLIQQKMLVAAGICDKILEGRDSWDSLFETCHMFHEYEHFLVVIASANEHLKWFGLIESKIRHLVNSIEKEYSSLVSAVRIWPKPFTKTKKTDTNLTTTKQLWFIGLEFHSHNMIHRDFRRTLTNFEETLLHQARSFHSQDMKIEGHFVLKSELTSLISKSEIQEIVSSQSQKKEAGTYKATSGLPETPGLTSTPLCSTIVGGILSQGDSFVPARQHVAAAPSYASATKGEGSKKMPLPNLPNVPTLGQGMPSNMSHRNYFGSPSGSCHSSNGSSSGGTLVGGESSHHQPIYNHVHSPLTRSHQPYGSQGSRTPIMERTWVAPTQNSGGRRNIKHGRKHQTSSSSITPTHHDGNGFSGVFNLNQEPVYPLQQHQMLEGTMDALDLTSPDHGPENGADKSQSSGSCSSSAGLDDASYSSLESDHGRSVSYSSDKFPPSSLVQARLHHVETLNFTTGSGSVHQSASVSKEDMPDRRREMEPQKSSHRISSSEICDVPTPAPIQSVQFQPLRFNFNSSSLQQLQAASDSVFN